MKISSGLTYLLPLILLPFTIYWITYYWSIEYFGYSSNDNNFLIGLSIAITVIYYLALRKLIGIVKAKYLKIIICVIPFLFQNIFEAIFKTNFSYQFFLPALYSVFLYLSFIMLDERYTATLNEGVIQYSTLLGQSGEIPLQSITKVEQKKNMLSFFFKEFKLLDITRKTCIAFVDENMDEYEINIFCPLFQGKKVFETIISKSTDLGNYKIREYEI